MDRLPPNSISGEESLLGVLLMDSPALAEVVQALEPSDFYVPSHQKVYSAIADLHKKNKPVDLITVTLALEETNLLNAVGGKSKLTDLVERGYMAYNPLEIVVIIKNHSTKRRLISVCNELINQLYDPEYSALELIQEYTEAFLSLGDRLRDSNSGLELIDGVMPLVNAEIERLNSEEDNSTLNTDVYDLDKLTGGFPRGGLSVIAGRASSGKTTVSLALALNLADQGKRVGYFSIEMTKVQIGQKILSRYIAGNVPSSQVEIKLENLCRSKGLLNIKDLSPYVDGMQKASELDFWIDDSSKVTVSHIRTEITKLVQQNKKPDIVFVDYVGIMHIEGRNQTRVLELDGVLKELRAIAKDFDIAIVGLQQISRGVDSQQDKRPGLKDIRESGGFEQEAALVLGLYNPKVYKNDADPVLEILVLKNRFGSPGTVTVGFEPHHNRLLSLAY
jgi:replicative DNA helicase